MPGGGGLGRGGCGWGGGGMGGGGRKVSDDTRDREGTPRYNINCGLAAMVRQMGYVLSVLCVCHLTDTTTFTISTH